MIPHRTPSPNQASRRTRRPAVTALAVSTMAFCALLGCSSGDLHLLPGQSSGGASDSPGTAGAAGANDPGKAPLPPPDCVSPECETIACSADPACRNECRAELAACAASCTQDEHCSTKAPFCDLQLALCTRCTRDEHCLLLYRGARSVCSDGLCLPCQASTECPDGVECQGGRCGDCVFDEDCSGDQICRGYTCQAP